MAEPRRVPLGILDLAPIVSGGSAAQALANTVELAQQAEALGFHRYWVAEHHVTPGVASSAPAVLLSRIAAATSTIRLGAGAVQTGHHTALAVVEQFGTLASLFPGRIDLGLGRSGKGRVDDAKRAARKEARGERPVRTSQVVDGLLVPAPYSLAALLTSPRMAFVGSLLQQEGSLGVDFGELVDQVLALLDGGLPGPEGFVAHAVPGDGVDVQTWLFGSSGGRTARVAGARGLRFAANYHVTPSNVLEAVEGYRAAFVPSRHLDRPYVAVSADVVVAPTDEEARHLASPYGLWVRSVRVGGGAIPFPSPGEAAAAPWTEEDAAIVADRVDTQLVGSPATVVERLETLQRVTGADELVVTTITHDHADRVRSNELLARAWIA